MRIQITNDSKGLAVWPGDRALDYDTASKTWVDPKCELRGGTTLDELADLLGIGDEGPVPITPGEAMRMEIIIP